MCTERFPAQIVAEAIEKKTTITMKRAKHVDKKQAKGQQAIVIPAKSHGSEDIIFSSPEELPVNSQQIIDKLYAEMAPLKTWYEIALAYAKIGRWAQFEEILKEVLKDDTYSSLSSLNSSSTYENEDTKTQMQVSLAGYFLDVGWGRIKPPQNQSSSDISSGLSNIDNTLSNISKSRSLPEIFVIKGLILLQQRDFLRAQTQFETALTSDKKYTSAILGLACAKFHLSKFEESLKLYQEALLMNPELSSIRLGLGFCFFQLNKFEKAKAAFTRVLEMNPKSLEALIGLSMIFLNEQQSSNPAQGTKFSSTEKGMAFTREAFILHPKNPVVLSKLANAFFYQSNLIECKKLGKMALSQLTKNPRFNFTFSGSSDVEKTKSKASGDASKAMVDTDLKALEAEIFFINGRTAHAQGNFESAKKNYERALKANSSFELAKFGLAQVIILESMHNPAQIKTAIKLLESILEAKTREMNKHSTNQPTREEILNATKTMEYFDVHKVLGILYSNFLNVFSRASEHLKIAFNLQKFDEIVANELGILENTDYMNGLNNLLRAEQVLDLKPLSKDKLSTWVPLYLNIGILHFINKNYELALKYLQKSLQKATENAFLEENLQNTMKNIENPEFLDEKPSFWADKMFKSELNQQNSTNPSSINWSAYFLQLHFNLARIYEEMSDFSPKYEEKLEISKKIYLTILKDQPTHLDSYIRLAFIENKKGNIKKATKWCEFASKISPHNNLMLKLLISHFHITRGEWSISQKILDKEFDDKNKEISKKFTFLKNLSLGLIWFNSKQSQENPEIQKRWSDHALKLFADVFNKSRAILNKTGSENEEKSFEKKELASVCQLFSSVCLGAIFAERGVAEISKNNQKPAKKDEKEENPAKKQEDKLIFNETSQIFSKIRETCADIPEVWIDLANMRMASEEYHQAASLYQKASEKFYDNQNVDLLMFIGRAHFKDQKFDDSLEVLEKAQEIITKQTEKLNVEKHFADDSSNSVLKLKEKLLKEQEVAGKYNICSVILGNISIKLEESSKISSGTTNAAAVITVVDADQAAKLEKLFLKFKDLINDLTTKQEEGGEKGKINESKTMRFFRKEAQKLADEVMNMKIEDKLNSLVEKVNFYSKQKKQLQQQT